MIALSALAACGGGGGGGGSVIQQPLAPAPTAHTEVPFTSFSAIAPNQTAIMPGLSQTGSGTATGFNLDSVDDSISVARLTFNAHGALSGITLGAPQSSVAFGADETGCATFGACAADNAAALAVVMNAADLGWNYQSFGVWMKDVSSTSFQAGAISAGAVTPGSAVPTTSSATFAGHAAGFYFDGAGGRFATDAQMSAVTDFANRNIQFSTGGTVVTDMGAPHNGATANTGLNLSGTLNYAAGVNQFSGNVKTQNDELTGRATGRFYGPSAQEIGGTYGLGSTDGKRMLGGFGGKR
jgi:hypothetical protein